MTDFSIARAPMLRILGAVLGVHKDRESAFLGRFQHLQRLKLIGGINPGRGKAAEYQAHQVLIVAVAMQMLQLGMTPERTVYVLRANQDRLRLAISIAVPEAHKVGHGMIWFDPASLSFDRAGEGEDWADATFDYGGFQTTKDRFAEFFDNAWVPRMSFVSVSNTVWALLRAIEGGHASGDHKPKLGENSRQFLASVRRWVETVDPDECL